MQVGAHGAVRHRALGAVPAVVAVSLDHPPERRRAVTQGGAPGVVLVADQPPRHRGGPQIRGEHDVADQPALAGGGLHVQDAEPLDRLAAGGAVAVPGQLVAAAHEQSHGAALQ